MAPLSPDTIGVLARMGMAMLCGGLLGLERQIRRKPAGLRTHMLVSLGAAAFTLVAFELFDRVAAGGDAAARMDPLRVIEAIVGGIGFLGAGSIIQARGSVEGLTTAGSLWFVGSVGIACGTGHFMIAWISVCLGLIVLIGVGLLERVLPRSS